MNKKEASEYIKSPRFGIYLLPILLYPTLAYKTSADLCTTSQKRLGCYNKHHHNELKVEWLTSSNVIISKCLWLGDK